jgi:hypothetical protein
MNAMDSSTDTPSQPKPPSVPHAIPQSEPAFATGPDLIVEGLEVDRAERDNIEPLDNVRQAIEHLSDLDPAEAASPGAAIADILSRALEEEDL